MTILQLRLQTCLQTILDIQPALRRQFRKNLAAEFLQLRKILANIENIEYNEDDIIRLEKIVSEFLQEIKFSNPYQLSYQENVQ